MSPNRIYIGYDPREAIAYNVAKNSILRRSNFDPLNIVCLDLENLPLLTRPIERRGRQLWCPISNAPMATEFAISRFCVPKLQEDGWGLFIDSDIVCQADINDLFALADSKYAVMVVKHKQESGGPVKMDGQIQTYYSRKNWSSVVLWNCSHPANKNLTHEMLNGSPGRELHGFNWLKDEEIGELPSEWNHLVGIDKDIENASIVHYTLGGPWFKDWKIQQSDYIWLDEVGLI